MISAHDSRLEEKSGKISQHRRYIGYILVHKPYIGDNFDGNQSVEQTRVLCFFSIFTDISVTIQ